MLVASAHFVYHTRNRNRMKSDIVFFSDPTFAKRKIIGQRKEFSSFSSRGKLDNFGNVHVMKLFNAGIKTVSRHFQLFYRYMKGLKAPEWLYFHDLFQNLLTKINFNDT